MVVAPVFQVQPTSQMSQPSLNHPLGWELREDAGIADQVRYSVYLHGRPKVLGLAHREVAVRVLRRLASLTL